MINFFLFALIGLSLFIFAYLIFVYFNKKQYFRFLLTVTFIIVYTATLLIFPNLFLRFFLSVVSLLLAISQIYLTYRDR
ncbi:hypothetical protein CBG46_07135 [Actinobacillus succinogenes]|nr:hypothetical protein CBG46_07135 [Actinobacillus succinogenes]